MKPDLQFSVLCDDVRREDNGKLMLIGLYEIIGGAEYPLLYPGMAVVNRWCNGLGEFRQRVRFVDSENHILVETAESPIHLSELRDTVTTVSLLRGVLVPRPGRYAMEVLLDGELKQRYAVGAVQMQLPDGPGRGPGRPDFPPDFGGGA